jgi:hypothetical protein
MTYQSKLFWSENRIHIQKRDNLVKWLSQFPEEAWFDIVITPKGAGNNTAQSKLYHKWCDILYKEFGWDSKAEMHEHLKLTYNGGESTRNFDTKDWSEYMIKVQAFANEHNINLPLGLSDE